MYSKGNICLHFVYAHIYTLCSILCNIHIYNILHASPCESYNDNYFSLKIKPFLSKRQGYAEESIFTNTNTFFCTKNVYDTKELCRLSCCRNMQT
jgi:hypothetical protein